MDLNTNYPIFNGQVPTGRVDRASFNQNFGYDQARDNYNFISGGNIYRMQNGNVSQIDTVANRQQQAAQQQFQQQQGSAINTLTTQKGNLGQQYSDLLKTVTGEYQPLINTTTATLNKELTQRGLTPDSTLFQQQQEQGLQPIYGQEAANAQQIGAGSISDTNALSQAIAQMQQGGAEFSAGLPLQYGSLALSQQALPANLAATYAQAANYLGQAQAAPYVQTGIPGITFNAANNKTSLLGAAITPQQIQRVLGF